jgi:hypothetical protein
MTMATGLGMINVRTKPSAALPQTWPRGKFSIHGAVFSYNLLNGHFGLVRCDDHARVRNLPDVFTDGNKTAEPKGQRSTFARWNRGRNRYALEYERGDCGGNADPDQDSPTCSTSTAKTKPEQRKPATRWVIRTAKPSRATPEDQNPSDRSELTPVPSRGLAESNLPPGPNDPIWPGFALSAERTCA